MDGEGSEQTRRVYEEQLEHKRDLVRNLELLLHAEQRRLNRLEQQLHRQPGRRWNVY